jgi:lipid II:glycine glycyltransferase (peptidoglycan interpeptide bridge formation enzyme)
LTVQPTASAWDAFVLNHPRGHLLQLSNWGKLKSNFGWSTQTIALQQGDSIVGGALVLLKSLPMHLGKMAYVPMGGYVTSDDLYPALWSAIQSETGAAFMKLEAGFFINKQTPDLANMGFHESPQTIQPPNTIYIDVTADDDTMMQRMNQGTRRKIRKSLKNDITYYEGTRADLADFNTLIQETGDRNEFGVHTDTYYEMVYDSFMPDHGVLLMAKHGDTPLVGIMVFAVGDTAWYLYGASSRDKSNLYATYGIQWQAMQWAKARGCTYYDMWGIPDETESILEAQFQERSDGLWGVYGFKRGWGGDVVRSLGTWDKVFNPIVYMAYRTALKLRG